MFRERGEIYQYASDIDFKILNEIFSDIKVANSFSMDIGGSLIKIAYKKTRRYKRKVPISQEKSYDYVDSEAEHSCLCFTKFETRHITECLNFLFENIISNGLSSPMNVTITGGGAIKFKKMINEKLNVTIDKIDEMYALVKGCTFLLRNIPDEVFYFEEATLTSVPHFSSACLMTTFPFLLVNIGSGVSILKVKDEYNFERVGGTAVGGGTFWGIGSLITGDDKFDNLLDMAAKGDYQNVDMLVKHAYGYIEQYELSGDLIASSFGRVSHNQEAQSKEDAINSLLVAISTNISQIACLNAKVHGLERIIFGGFFTRGQILTMKLISSSVQFWSKGEQRAMFLRHEGYLGAIGAYLSSLLSGTSESFPETDMTHKENNDQTSNLLHNSWLENYAESNSFYTSKDYQNEDGNVSPQADQEILTKSISDNLNANKTNLTNQYSNQFNNSTTNINHSKSLHNVCLNFKALIGFETRELECLKGKLEVFHLLYSPETYLPDSWDLTADQDARCYWLNCFKGHVPLQTVIDSQKEQSDTAEERAQDYQAQYLKYLFDLESNPTLHGILTVRCLLDAHQTFLRKFGFTDPFWIQKKKENELAIRTFRTRMNYLNSLSWEERQYELVIGFLAGNVFDWGSKQVCEMMKEAEGGVIDFSVAKDKLQKRPWLIDGYNRWFKKMSSKPITEPVYECILIFCDNSGFDCIIGMIPFVIEMLSRGTNVILSANSEPAINDVTHSELVILIKTLCQQSSILENAIKNNKLLLVPNGQVSPCLDLRFISNKLNLVSKSKKVDLVLIEGMARAIHTNLYARFNCDSLKLAVIKNGWLANRLGGDIFSVVFQYEAGISL